MIHAIAIADPSQPIMLRHYIERYYDRVDRMNIFINSAEVPDSSGKLLYHPYPTEYNYIQFRQFAEIYFRHTCSKDDWALCVDVDEVVDFDMRAEIQRADQGSFLWIRGVMVDCIAPGGELPELTDAPLEEQFPLQCDLTARLVGGHTQKCILAKYPWLSADPHSVPTIEGLALPALHTIYHYKWCASVVDKMKKRADLLTKQMAAHRVEPQRVLDHINKFGKLNVEELAKIGVTFSSN
jgi:hypothetical protein